MAVCCVIMGVGVVVVAGKVQAFAQVDDEDEEDKEQDQGQKGGQGDKGQYVVELIDVMLYWLVIHY